jgi:hypothetical protein
MNARRVLARATAVVATSVVVTGGLVTSAWAGAAGVASGSPTLNTGSQQLVFTVASTYLPSPATVTVTLQRHGTTATEDRVTGSGAYSSGKVTTTLDFARANPGAYDATLSQGPVSDSCSSCVTVNAFGPVVTSVSPSALGEGTTGSGYQPFVIDGQNFTKGPYTQCTSDSCTGPSVAVYRTGTSTPDANVTLSATRNADDTADAPTATTASAITLRIDVTGDDTASYVDDVVVTNSDGKSSRCTGCLTIEPQPVITSVQLVPTDFPDSPLTHIGRNATGQTVIVRGDRFPSDAHVYWLRPDSADDSESINIGTHGTPQADGEHQKIVLTNVSTTEVQTLGDASGNNAWRAIVSSATLRNSSEPAPFPVTAEPTVSDLTAPDSSTGGYGQGATGVDVDATITNGVAGSGTTPHSLVRFVNSGPRSWVKNQTATTTHVIATLDIPESAPTGGYPFRVVNPDGGASAVCDNSVLLFPNTCLLTVATGPKVTRVAPSSAAPGGSVPITITGTGFHTGSNAVAVRIGPADDPVFSDDTVTPTNSTTIAVTVDLSGATSPDDLDVVVTNNDDRGTGTKADGFHVVNFTIGSPDPSSGVNEGLLPIHIPGADLPDDVTVSLVQSGVPAIAGAITDHGADFIDATFDVDQKAPGSYDVVVSSATEGTATCAECFLLQANPPSIATVAPDALGAGATDVAITVTGDNLYDGATLVFSNPGIHLVGDADVTEPDTLVQHVSVDADAATGAGTVKVTNTDGKSSTTKPFTVDAGPTVTGIEPTSHAAGSSFTLTVTGTNFAEGAHLSLSEDPIDVSNVQRPDAEHVTATLSVPASVTAGGAPVAVTVTVVNPDHGQATSPTDLTIDPPPSIDAIDPSRVANTWDPFTLTVTGEHFAPGADLTGSGLTVTDVTVVDASTIHATVDPAGATAGSHTITVDNGDGGTDTANLVVFTRPSAPRNVAARSRSHALIVSWTSPASNGGDAVISYTATLLRHSTGKAVASYTTPSAATQIHRFTGLSNGVRYDVRVVATNHAGNSVAGTASGRPTFATKLTIKRSARTITKGDTVTLSGRLTRSDGTPLAGRRVAVLRSAFTVSKRIAVVRTNAHGKWRLTLTPKRTAKYQARFSGDRADRPSSSDNVRVRVRR